MRRVATPVAGGAPWPPFVVFALASTLLVGVAFGALDLWSLRVLGNAVPLAHHRAHAIAQVFGFLGLFTMGISLHLAPRFFGAELPRRTFTRALTISSMVGVGGVVVGQLGALLPGSAWFASTGAVLLMLSFTAWAWWVTQLWRRGAAPHTAMHRFLLAGSWWWSLAAVSWLAWPWLHMPVDAVWTAAIFGGATSWLLGVFLRAGLCTLRLEHPPESALSRVWWVWQIAVALLVMSRWWSPMWLEASASLAMAAASTLVLTTLRPWAGANAGDGTLRPRAVQAGFVFFALYGAFELWSFAGVLGAWTPPLLRDATRHAFTLGSATLMVFGFAGRMVPGFSGRALRWPRLYDGGVLFLVVAAVTRLCELLPLRAGLSVAGASGGLAFIGIALVSGSLLGSLTGSSAR